jgi:hypothetical protein
VVHLEEVWMRCEVERRGLIEVFAEREELDVRS